MAQSYRYVKDSDRTKWDAASVGAAPEWDAIQNKPVAVTSLLGTNTGDQDLSGKANVSHGHSQSDISNLVNDLSGKEPANANIQAHIASGHAPSNAQANTDITKAEIEAKLTGVISSHSHAGSTPPTVVTLASNQATGANVTPVTLTGLSFAYEINSKYRIWAMGRVQPTAATTGCGFQFDISSVVTSISILHIHQLANTGTLSGGHSIGDDASVGVSSGMPGTSTYPVTLLGLLVTGANAGTAQLKFRSETTAVTTCLAGFTLVVEKIA